jgi:hypothetical protein
MGAELLAPLLAAAHLSSRDAKQDAESLPGAAFATAVDSVAKESDQPSSAWTPEQSSVGSTAKRTWPAPAEASIQHSHQGLRFVFDDGGHPLLPDRAPPWRVRLSDLDTANIIYATEIKSRPCKYSKRYFVRFRIESRRDHHPRRYSQRHICGSSCPYDSSMPTG